MRMCMFIMALCLLLTACAVPGYDPPNYANLDGGPAMKQAGIPGQASRTGGTAANA